MTEQENEVQYLRQAAREIRELRTEVARLAGYERMWSLVDRALRAIPERQGMSEDIAWRMDRMADDMIAVKEPGS